MAGSRVCSELVVFQPSLLLCLSSASSRKPCTAAPQARLLRAPQKALHRTYARSRPLSRARNRPQSRLLRLRPESEETAKLEHIYAHRRGVLEIIWIFSLSCTYTYFYSAPVTHILPQPVLPPQCEGLLFSAAVARFRDWVLSGRPFAARGNPYVLSAAAAGGASLVHVRGRVLQSPPQAASSRPVSHRAATKGKGALTAAAVVVATSSRRRMSVSARSPSPNPRPSVSPPPKPQRATAAESVDGDDDRDRPESSGGAGRAESPLSWDSGDGSDSGRSPTAAAAAAAGDAGDAARYARAAETTQAS